MPRGIFVLKFILAWRDYIIATAAPLILSLLFLYDGTEYQKPARCTFVLLILVIFWTTECVPIAVTALLPMFLYPLLKITTAKDLAPKYMSEVNMAFVGSYIMVLAFEHANLHKRFALRILLTVGAQPRWLLFGIMMSACFLSMFTNNTMSCALHLPIVKGIIDELREASKHQQSNGEKQPPAEEDRAAKAAVESSTAAMIAQERSHNGNSEAAFDNPNFEDVLVDVPGAPQNCSEGDIEMQTVAPPHLLKKPIKGILKVRTLSGRSLEMSEDEGKSGKSTATMISVQQQQEEGSEVLSSKVIDGIEKMLLISAAYSASIGGMCTLIGTPTNLIMKERAEKVFEAYNCTQPVTFTSWLVFGLPVGYMFIFVAWFWLQFFYLGPKYVFDVWILDPVRRFFRKKSAVASTAKDPATIRAERITAVIRQLYAQLEPMGFQQYAVVGHCIVLIILLITRQMSAGDDGGIGWDVVAPKFTKESTATILVSSMLFIFPSSLPNFRSAEIKAAKPLLSWKHVDKEFPFGVILLLGGGMAAAAGAQDSGLPNLIAPVFRDVMKDISLSLCVLLTAVVVAAMTEFMSNVACVTLISPIMENLAKELNVSPLLFLFPTTLASSFAFMLPVATPPNALVFSTNRLKIIDMVLCGIGMNIIGVLIVTLSANTWGNAYFSLYKPPCS